MNNYKVLKGTIEKFVEINGTKSLKSLAYKEIENGLRNYYYIEKNHKLYDDFYTFNNSNELGIFYKNLENKDLMISIFDILKNEFKEIKVIIPKEEINTIEFIRNNYNVIFEEDIKQDKYDYTSIILKL